MEQYGWLIWLAMMVLFGVVEMATVNLVSIWFVGGSLAAMIAALAGAGIWTQLILFLVTAGALLSCLRPFVRKYVTPNRTATNADMALGREAYLTESVDNIRGTGALKLDGKVWTVRSADQQILPEGTLVKIVRLEGVKLYVMPVHTTAGV